MDYVLGVDAGNSRTLCALAAVDGRLASIGYGGAANYKLVGTSEAQRSIAAAMDDAKHRAAVADSNIAAAFYAVSGLDTEEDRNIIRRFLETINPGCIFALDNDSIASLVLGTAAEAGVVVIFAAGSNCVAFNGGRRLQVGGLGREFGDFSSGREIAIQGLAAAMRGYDGRAEPTMLYDMISDYLGMERLAEFSTVLHHSGRAYPIANLAPLVFRAAERGDAPARLVLAFNGKELGLAMAAAVNRAFASQDEVDVIITGGLLGEDTQGILMDSLRKTVLHHCGDRIHYVFPEGEPVLGAIMKALTLHGTAVDDTIRRRLVERCRELIPKPLIL